MRGKWKWQEMKVFKNVSGKNIRKDKRKFSKILGGGLAQGWMREIRIKQMTNKAKENRKLLKLPKLSLKKKKR
jgi:hypothetical protein